jgi:hypothetical protein
MVTTFDSNKTELKSFIMLDAMHVPMRTSRTPYISGYGYLSLVSCTALKIMTTCDMSDFEEATGFDALLSSSRVLNPLTASIDKQHAIQQMIDDVMKIQFRTEADNWNSQFYAVPL